MKHLLFPLALCGFFTPACLAAPVTAEDKSSVITAVTEHLETAYVLPGRGAKAALRLKDEATRTELQTIEDGEAFAKVLTDILQEETGDGHLNVEYSEEPIDLDAPAEDSFSEEEMNAYYGPQLNHGVQKFERLEGNVGLLELSVFPPLNMGAETWFGALASVVNTDALIIDLRKNGGGAETSELLKSFLVGGTPRPLSGTYNRPSDESVQAWTWAHYPGKRYGEDKPVYILISKRTFSAAESVAYDMQALGRAVIVGEASGGGAHPFEYLPVHPHFVLWSVTERSVNPITGSNWQDVGVQPDIRVPADQALKAALEHLSQILPIN